MRVYILIAAFIAALLLSTSPVQSQPAKDGGACSILYDNASKLAEELGNKLYDNNAVAYLQESADFDEAARWARINDDGNSKFCSPKRLVSLKLETLNLSTKLKTLTDEPDTSAIDTAVKNVDRWLNK